MELSYTLFKIINKISCDLIALDIKKWTFYNEIYGNILFYLKIRNV